ncbi:hypothetical protein SNOG_06404 [Parastagonospora nodorum SN15]|uniref:Uncharacterized protein n=1 Tax=Phaeosphaeria nodorum (strain SN15 / ATCC MYA-4574 / FGSC 10173) TaxID=321614 RepID=Q0UPB0_PHANO|nr:hypothetical protein SNOG_06404 [Parastagonospora nodorum SN15]EAT86235.1 hypothetical protein SNOG_06404 [Parastagonospora nodorum SN15]
MTLSSPPAIRGFAVACSSSAAGICLELLIVQCAKVAFRIVFSVNFVKVKHEAMSFPRIHM